VIPLPLSDGHLPAETHDDSKSLPVRRSADEVGGRGLELIEGLSNRWGAHPDPDGGKTVWFEIVHADR